MGNNQASSVDRRDAELSNAAGEGKLEQVGALLSKGANPNRQSGKERQRTPLHRAALAKNNVDVLTMLLDHIRDVDGTDADGNTALHFAAGYYNNAAVVRQILRAKPNCNIQNAAGRTALHSAVIVGSDIKVAELLLKAGADPNVADWEGNTALHLCAGKRGVDPMIVGMLLRFGANANLVNEKKQTSLHVAAKTANDTVLLLLRYNANVMMRDNDGHLPSDVASTEEIRTILLWEEKRVQDSGPTAPRNGLRTSESSVGSSGSPQRSWGGNGVIKVMDAAAMGVPPQALPYGTTVELKITPRADGGGDGWNYSQPQQPLDLTGYDIDFELEVDLPGLAAANFARPDDGRRGADDRADGRMPPTCTAMWLHQGVQWKSLRDFAFKPDGVASFNFRLTREKAKISPVRFSKANVDEGRAEFETEAAPEVRQRRNASVSSAVTSSSSTPSSHSPVSTVDEPVDYEVEETEVAPEARRRNASVSSAMTSSPSSRRSPAPRSESDKEEEEEEPSGPFDAIVSHLHEYVNDPEERDIAHHVTRRRVSSDASGAEPA